MRNSTYFHTTAFSAILVMGLNMPILAQQPPTASDSSQTAVQDPAGVVYDDPAGVTVEFEPDGSDWKKIYSMGEADLTFGDRKDIQNARRKAELGAKAAIAKFLNETIKSEETLEDITKTMTESNASSAGKDTTANRKTVETLTNKISNSSEAILKGVLILEQKDDIPNKRVTVKVGMSRKTMATADSVKRTLKPESSQPAMAPPPSDMATDQAGEPASTTTIRRSKNANDF